MKMIATTMSDAKGAEDYPRKKWFWGKIATCVVVGLGILERRLKIDFIFILLHNLISVTDANNGDLKV